MHVVEHLGAQSSQSRRVWRREEETVHAAALRRNLLEQALCVLWGAAAMSARMQLIRSNAIDQSSKRVGP